MNGLEAAAGPIAAQAGARGIARAAAALRAALPDVDITETAGGVTLTGRGLLARAWDEAALRWVAQVVREETGR